MYRHITSNKSPYKKITYYTSYGDKVAHVHKNSEAYKFFTSSIYKNAIKVGKFTNVVMPIVSNILTSYVVYKRFITKTPNKYNGYKDRTLYTNKGDLQKKYNGPKARPKKIGGKYKDLNTNYTLKGDYTYVIDENGKLIIAPTSKMKNGMGHTSLSGGRPVKYAGTIKFSKSGKLDHWTNASGHYEPSAKDASTASNLLRKNGLKDANLDNFKGFNHK